MRSSRSAAAFSVLLVSVLASDATAVAEENQPSPAAVSNPVAAQSLDQLSATLDRPLFSPTRRPPAPPPPVAQVVAPPPPPPPPPNLVLFGVVIDGEGARAVVRAGADKKLLRAQIGDEIDGWKVSQIEGRKVVLSLDGRFATFTLFSDDREKQQAAGAPMPGGELKNSQIQGQGQQASAQAAAPQAGQPRKRRRSHQ
jgi:hypothetical protein